MNLRLMLASAVIASSALLAAPAAAHDPSQFDRMMQTEKTPTTETACAELEKMQQHAGHADAAKTKTLKTRCDAEKKAARTGDSKTK